MTSFRTGVQDLISDSDGTNGVGNPMTPALNSTDFKSVRIRLLSYGTSGLQVQPLVQFSDDGVNWTSVSSGLFGTLATPTDGAIYTPSGWGTIDIYTHASPKPFVRFGLHAKSTSTGDPRSFQAEIEVKKVGVVQSLTIPWERQLVFSAGGANMFAITPVLDASAFDEARATVELESDAETSGQVAFRVVCQEVNKPKVPSDYTVDVYVPSSTYQTATLIGTTFTALSPDKRFIQFYAQVTRSGGSVNDLVLGRIRTRVDLRKL